MIEIALDETLNDIFFNHPRPVFEVEELPEFTWDGYVALAKQIIEIHAEDQIIILRNRFDDLNINLLAVALFVQSCLKAMTLECVVIKVKNKATALEQYKPYVALSIGLKYMIHLFMGNHDMIYKEISELSYLGIEIKQSYLHNCLDIYLKADGDLEEIVTTNKEQALSAIGIIKSMTLNQTKANIHAKISTKPDNEDIDIERAVENTVKNVMKKFGLNLK